MRVTCGDFRPVYDPSIGEERAWYVNDHTFVRDAEGVWHLFGITHEAAEYIVDEQGAWWVSHAGWGQGGVFLAPLSWND